MRYHLTRRELALLLASQKAESVYGFAMPRERYSRNQVIEILQGLVKKELVESDGKTFRIELGLRAILKSIREANYFLHLESASGRSSDVCFYVEEGALLVAASVLAQRGDTIRLWHLEKEGLASWMEEAGYLPDCWIDPDILPREGWEEDRQKLLWSMTGRNKEGICKMLWLEQGGLYYRLLCHTGDKTSWEFYNRDQLKRDLAWMMEG